MMAMRSVLGKTLEDRRTLTRVVPTAGCYPPFVASKAITPSGPIIPD